MKAVAVFDPNSSFNRYGISGFILFEDSPDGSTTRVTFNLEDLPPRDGALAVHIHESGDLRYGCEGACAHFNPDGKLHGSYDLHGLDHHAGDLINNIAVQPDGTCFYYYDDPLITVKPGPYSIVGRSVVIHGGVDDGGAFRDRDRESATTGNAGERIACAVIGLARECKTS